MYGQIIEKLLSGEYSGLSREKVINTLNNMITRKFLVSALEKPSNSSSSLSQNNNNNKIELELPKVKSATTTPSKSTSSSATKRKPKPLLQLNNKKIKTDISLSSSSSSSILKSNINDNNSNKSDMLFNQDTFYRVNYDEFAVEFKKRTVLRYVKDRIDERSVGIVEGILNVLATEEKPKDIFSLSLTLDEVYIFFY